MLLGLTSVLRRLRLTTQVILLVLAAVVSSITAVSIALYAKLASGIGSTAIEQQASDVRAAATGLVQGLKNYGAQLEWQGDAPKVNMWVIPQSIDAAVIDALSRVVGSRTAVIALGADGHGSVVASTFPAGALGEPAEITLGPDLLANLKAAEPATLEQVLGADSYSSTYLPVADAKGELLGTILVAQNRAGTEGLLKSTLLMVGLASGASLLVVGALSFWLSRLLLRPIPALARIMQRIVAGELDLAIPFSQRRGEIGDMVRAIEVFRDNTQRITELTESERRASVQRAEDRGRMMEELQASFGEVVDAAAQGDFGRRARTDFANPELNSIAGGINALVDTVERGLSETADVLEALGAADLTKSVRGEYQGAFLRLKTSTNAVRGKLWEVLSRLKDNSGTLKVATNELLIGSTDLSQRTNRQALVVQETTSAIARIAATVREMADQAGEAKVKSTAASDLAVRGFEAMSEANAAMDRINEASTKISGIIAMIDDIAFQTNLLALNASVEAARAGESGRGFAVVAAEVRRLAQIAAGASSDAKQLIGTSSSEVQIGTRRMRTAIDELGAVREAVSDSEQAMAMIAQANASLASSFDQVTQSIRRLDEATQHNAALVEETNSAIEQTQAQAADLDEIVSVFRLADAA
jgi:methyl-accepting chemotaxis protein